MAPKRKTLQVLQPSAANKNVGKISQVGKVVPKRKQWAIEEEEKGSKRVKAEVKTKTTQTEENAALHILERGGR
ncbi:hypothetical protein CRUP_037005 [Coryphaenoides rupestris]|nr:hypothetical protein CRUP_037005 [Coryphaenoides rupestris]